MNNDCLTDILISQLIDFPNDIGSNRSPHTKGLKDKNKYPRFNVSFMFYVEQPG